MRPVRTKPAAGCSLIVTCGLVVPNRYSLNCCWLSGSAVCWFTPPSFTSVKLAGSSGALLRVGLVVVKLKGVELKKLRPLAPRTFFVTVRMAGKTTAELDVERSWLPPAPCRSSTRMW